MSEKGLDFHRCLQYSHVLTTQEEGGRFKETQVLRQTKDWTHHDLGVPGIASCVLSSLLRQEDRPRSGIINLF